MNMNTVLVLSFLVLVCCGLSLACRTSADCRQDECCMAVNRPIGRRQIVHDAGRCQPRPTLSGGCLMRDSVYDPHHMYFMCPCQDGLVCKGNGMIDIPLGEMGACVSA